MSVTQSGERLFAVVAITTVATNSIVLAVANNAIVLDSYTLSFTGTGAFTFKFIDSGANSLSGAFDVIGVYTGGGDRSLPQLSTAVGNALQITTTGTTASVHGHITYHLEPKL